MLISETYIKVEKEAPLGNSLYCENRLKKCQNLGIGARTFTKGHKRMKEVYKGESVWPWGRLPSQILFYMKHLVDSLDVMLKLRNMFDYIRLTQRK